MSKGVMYARYCPKAGGCLFVPPGSTEATHAVLEIAEFERLKAEAERLDEVDEEIARVTARAMFWKNECDISTEKLAALRAAAETGGEGS